MGLPIYRITIKDSDYELMKRNVWSDKFFSATMVNGDKKQPIQIRYRGGHTREYPKKSYEVRTARATYHFNAEYDDPSLLRNALSFHFFQSIGVPAPATRHCVIYINGRLEGVYLRIEGVKSCFFRKRGLSARSIIYAVNDHADFTLNGEQGDGKKTLFSGYRLIKGTQTDRRRLIEFVRNINRKKGTDLYNYLRHRLDLDNYLRWLCGAVLTGNYDGFHQNYTIFEHRKRKVYGMLPWDYEGTWGRNCYGKAVRSDLVRIRGYNQLTEKIMSYKVLRQRYKSLLQGMLASSFTVNRIMPVASQMYHSIARDVYNDPRYKWDIELFDYEPDLIRQYIEHRRYDIRREIETL